MVEVNAACSSIIGNFMHGSGQQKTSAMIYTSCFARTKKIEAKHPSIAFVSIAGKCPSWYDGLQCKALAPRYSWWQEWHEKFKGCYESEESKSFYAKMYHETVLSRLDPHVVEQKLCDLAGSRCVCLLCYEKPGLFCHRHLVREWLLAAGIECEELELDP